LEWYNGLARREAGFGGGLGRAAQKIKSSGGKDEDPNVGLTKAWGHRGEIHSRRGDPGGTPSRERRQKTDCHTKVLGF